ncbi:MAG: response regulator transcription factor [Acidobacteriota bacterium]
MDVLNRSFRRPALAGTETVVVTSCRAVNRIKVLLVDDHVVMRQALARLFCGEPDIEVVGEASDGQIAVEMTRRIQPDVVLMDICMPRLNGIEATRQICAELPDISVIALSMLEEARVSKAVLKAGAVAHLTKTADPCILTAAVRNCRIRQRGNLKLPVSRQGY